MKKLLILTLGLLLTGACGSAQGTATVTENHNSAVDEDRVAAEVSVEKDIVDTAVAAGNFTTLAAALAAADLIETLKGDGPYTVFAPTDAAFEALPEGTVASLLEPENRDQLIAILTYHVVPGKVAAADVATLSTANTVNGAAVSIDATDGVMINDANVVQADIECSNGMIHVVDKVLLPPQ